MAETPLGDDKVMEASGKGGKLGGGSKLFPTATGMALNKKVVSYADVCLGINGNMYDNDSSEDDGPLGVDTNCESSDDEVLKDVNEPEEDPLCPVFKVTKEELKEAQQQWRMLLIVNLLGKKVGLRILQTRLMKLWKPIGVMDVIDLENDYYIVRFSEMIDLYKAFMDGPWRVVDHYLIVQRWH